MDIKPGFLTSEFWLAPALLGANILASKGIIANTDIELASKAISTIILGIISMVIYVSYNINRAEVKKTAIENTPKTEVLG